MKNSDFNTSNWTLRSPRTTEQAFGPGSSKLSYTKPKIALHNRLLLYVGVPYILFAVGLMIFNLLKG